MKVICTSDVGLMDCGSFVRLRKITSTEIGVLDAGGFEGKDKKGE